MEQVAGTSELINYPVLVSLSSDADLQQYVQREDGGDIVFTDTAGVKLPHEIEYYNSANGGFVSWVNVPSLFPTQDTVSYILRKTRLSESAE